MTKEQYAKADVLMTGIDNCNQIINLTDTHKWLEVRSPNYTDGIRISFMLEDFLAFVINKKNEFEKQLSEI